MMTNKQKQVMPGEKTTFFLKNLLRGLSYLAVLLVAYYVIKNNVSVGFVDLLEPLFENVALILSIYTLSELLFGIIPPELFMIWALRTGTIPGYAFYIFLFAVISYVAGFLGYLFGAYLDSTLYYRYVRKRLLGKYHSLLQKYGVFLILVAALTPLPYSGISMLMGSFRYPVKKYLIWALSRFIRYAAYAAVIWKTALL
jgi:membrane protein DedA with SNARE-associated domain